MKDKQAMLIFAAKCIACVLIVYFLSGMFSEDSLLWVLISSIIVLSPEASDTSKLTVVRIQANFIGASVATLLFFLPIQGVIPIVLGLGISVFLSFRLGVQEAARSACIALLIVLQESSDQSYWTGIDRLLSVVSGCILGWFVTYAIHNLFRIVESD